MPFANLVLRRSYSSEESNLLEDFYLPALRSAVSYDRAVGYFSGPMLSYAATALDGLIKSGGTMRLLIGDPLDEEEFLAVKRGAELRDVYARFDVRLRNILETADTLVLKHHLELLSWLVAMGKLEVKLALVPRGLYHEKIGILRDSAGQSLVFQGSANETQAALLPDFNYESIAVYPSWDGGVYEAYGAPLVARFQRLWTGAARNVVTVAIPSESYERFRSHYKGRTAPTADEAEFRRNLTALHSSSTAPSLPGSMHGTPYALMEHQREALRQWQASGYRGVMALATGAGKTITALHGATMLAREHIKAGNRFILIVSVPYQVLGDQWAEVMTHFGMRPIKCFRSKSQWSQELREELASAALSKDGRFVSIVVVNATLFGSEFQAILAGLDTRQIMLVGDECHHLGSEDLVRKLPAATLRLGLSATPWNVTDVRRKDVLVRFFGPIVARYTIRNALSDGVLAPYEYQFSVCALEPDEQEAYETLSSSIARIIAIREQGGPVNETELNRLLSERSRLVGSAAGKFARLRELIRTQRPETHSLFYCGDGAVEAAEIFEDSESEARVRDVERVAILLANLGWRTSRFTADETHRERLRIMENFKQGDIHAIVAIRVLDEGFDMPICKTAYLMASSRSERQFIQRRGRVLRRAPGKQSAFIHDFLVVPADGRASAHMTRLAEQELVRALEFSRFASNALEATRQVRSLCDKHTVDFEAVEQTVKQFEEGA